MEFKKDLSGPLEFIANHYGLNAQRTKTIEELAELIRALVRTDLADIAEEIADVEIMLYQFKYLTGTTRDIDWIKDQKVTRQLERIKSEEEKNDNKDI